MHTYLSRTSVSSSHVAPLRQGEGMHAVWSQSWSPEVSVVMALVPVMSDIIDCKREVVES